MQTFSYKQPKGLYLLFFTEMWERFGFYTLQAIIILYMTKGLLFTDNKANYLYAAFSSLLYITPVVGGYIADRYLGFQQTIIVGGILLLIGYILTAFQSSEIFFIGLSVLICANGLFKPNVSSIVGELYSTDDPRRDGGFTLFYMGINIGSLIPPIFTGAAVAHYGWHAGFILAAIGMAIGLIVFTWGKKRLEHRGAMPTHSPLYKSPRSQRRFYFLFIPLLVVAIALCHLALHYPLVTNSLVEITAVIIALVTIIIMCKEPKQVRNKMLASLILIAISVGFWALYNQTFTSLTLFADRNMVQHLWKIPLNAEAMQFFNPFFIIILSPILSIFWVWLSRRNLNPSIPAKFCWGVFFMSIGFLLLGFGAQYFAKSGLLSPNWLIWSYLLQTVGELLISPIGLSMITVLTPKHLVGMMMGVWFFALAAAFALGGVFANIAAVPAGTSITDALSIYNHAFYLLGWMSLGLTVLCFFSIPYLKRMISDGVKI